MSLNAAIICLIACHGASADHFSVFAEKLLSEGYEVQVYASEHALKKFQDRQIPITMPFKTDQLSPEEEKALAAEIAKSCRGSVVLTDVGNPFDITLQKTIAADTPETFRLAYYDNPEPFVPGGYSKVAAEVMGAAQRVLFANANLVHSPLIDIPFQNRVGLGYYPTAQADKIAKRRGEEGGRMRRQLFDKFGLRDTGQKVLVYFGGNNEEYFTKAYPAFLSFLSEGIDLSNYIFIMQQHPGAKSKNIDRQMLEDWIKEHQNAPRVILSDWTSDDIQVIADGALYYQTSMGPLFALAGIPMAQVGHNTFEDVMVRSGLCLSATNTADFVEVIGKMKSALVTDEQRQSIYKSIGIREDWFEVFKQALKT